MNFEADNDHQVTVEVTDSASNVYSESFTINLTDDTDEAGVGAVSDTNAAQQGGLSNAQGNILGVDAKLGALADNGGLTQTHLLLAGSLAIDGGRDDKAVDADGKALTTDQRGTGFPRINGVKVDMGAVES